MYFGDNSRFYTHFSAYMVEKTIHIPHGVKYNLTLHDTQLIGDTRLLGFDNSHGGNYSTNIYISRPLEWDHVHKFKNTSHYTFTDCNQLMADFWDTAKEILNLYDVDIA